MLGNTQDAYGEMTIGVFVPIVGELGEMSYQYDRDYVFDSAKFESRFSYRPVGYTEGIKEMVAAG